MNIYFILTILISVSALFAYVNHRFIKMPFIIGVFFLSTVVSLVVLSSKYWLIEPHQEIKSLIEQTQISKLILNIILGFLLFAGGMHTNWFRLKAQLKKITFFAVAGVLMSTFVVAILFYFTCSALNLPIDFIYCLLFGALISPTDPIAVLGILKKAGVPEKTETIIVGESLFNDGIGVVLFIALLDTLKSELQGFSFGNFGVVFLQEAVGGILFGLVCGMLLHSLLRSIDHYETEVLLTLSFVMAGYSFANYFHLSGPLAMVVMGLLVGNYKQEVAMSDVTQQYVLRFWELIEVVLNGILFIIVALLLDVINFEIKFIIIGVISIFIVLLARILVVYIPRFFLPKFIDLTKKEAKLMVWGGLRGGLSLALVLSLPDSNAKTIMLVATYICVLFSILIQGLTIGKLAAK